MIGVEPGSRYDNPLLVSPGPKKRKGRRRPLGSNEMRMPDEAKKDRHAGQGETGVGMQMGKNEAGREGGEGNSSGTLSALSLRYAPHHENEDVLMMCPSHAAIPAKSSTSVSAATRLPAHAHTITHTRLRHPASCLITITIVITTAIAIPEFDLVKRI